MLRFDDKRITHALLEKNPKATYNEHQKKKLYFNDSNLSFLMPTIECLDVPIKCTEALMIGSMLHNRKGVAYEDHS